MPDRRWTGRRLRAALRAGVVLIALPLALSACGVPDSGPAVVVSKAPLGTSDNAAEATRPEGIGPPDPSTASGPADLVQLFLTAAGADPDRIAASVTPFLTADQRDRWRPDTAGITLVRVTEIGSGEPKNTGDEQAPEVDVRVTGQRVGLLTTDGAVQPVPDGRPTGFRQTFHVQQVRIAGGSEWRIANPPTETLLSTDMMSIDYEPVSLYFAAPDHHHVVPDLRYVPTSMPPAKQRTVLVDWLLDGPSAWLGEAVVNEIPDGTKRRGNVVLEHGTVVVNLTSDAAEADHPNTMAAQLAWTLASLGPRIKILIEGSPMRLPAVSNATYDWRTWQRSNINTVPGGSGGYYVSHGEIVPVRSDETVPAVLNRAGDEVDSNVRSAALAVDSTAAAVVRVNAHGKPELWIGQDERVPAFTRAAGLRGTSIGTPSFVATSGIAVVPVDGRLKAVRANGDVSAVGFAEQAMTGVTAAAVAPDGSRIAVIAGGEAYLASLSLDDTTHLLTIGRPRPVATGFTSLTGLAWTQEDGIVLAGRGRISDGSLVPSSARDGVWRFSIDGVGSELLTGSLDSVPEQVGSSIGDPANASSHGVVLLSVHQRLLQISGNDVMYLNGEARAPRGTAPFFPS